MVKTFYEFDENGQPCNHRQVFVLKLEPYESERESLGVYDGKFVKFRGFANWRMKTEDPPDASYFQ